ncbi:aldo/keto reductase [Thermoactinomyces sp. DSM 45892]|uniref:aldo/keto reductase n=1 Tax=Thermoactinomyces sp. DSM 45892 TaxID=1882753 RepID=UPI00089D2FBD|nr:aldo/keto reductase [Thermoactinomyces sp. DSM 45892]SDY23764.1 Aldo/keto reductase family protein [Thermoactinomyces sp. DSM 45892]
MGLSKLCYGTWQFESNFNKVSRSEAISLVAYAIELGIESFDTALVYGQGDVEKILSEFDMGKKNVITKIPAKRKPFLQEKGHIRDFYDEAWIEECLTKSIQNLKCNPKTVLLHNWSDNWREVACILQYLGELKKQGVCQKIGLSLPNSYNGVLNSEILSLIDILETPYNVDDVWIENNYRYLESNGIEVIIRSLFKQGNFLLDKEDKEKIVKEAFTQASLISSYIAVGMTSKEQIERNVEIFKCI